MRMRKAMSTSSDISVSDSANGSDLIVSLHQAEVDILIPWRVHDEGSRGGESSGTDNPRILIFPLILIVPAISENDEVRRRI